MFSDNTNEFYTPPIIVVNPKYVFAKVNNIIIYLVGSGFLICSCAEFSDYSRTCRHVELGRQLYSFDYSYSQTNGVGLFVVRRKDDRKWFITLDKLQPDEEILDVVDDKYTFISAFSSVPVESKKSSSVILIKEGNEISINNFNKTRKIISND